MRHVLSALVMNQPGVLAHIAGMLASRAFNIVSLAVGETEVPRFSRVTLVVNGDEKTLDQVSKQLEKVVTVVKVLDFDDDFVERDMLLIKVQAAGESRARVQELTESDSHYCRIVDERPEHVMFETSGTESEIESFIDQMRPFGIIELVRTGRVAMSRTGSITDGLPEPVFHS
ncbi:MAG: acetolactate synthase small subunit [Planctomycetota bacterium]|nr:acetolactate synthase small subunit [Planctomycetota bacterium]